MKETRILVAEDDANLLHGLVATLESEGYHAVPAADGERAFMLLKSERFDLVILDIMMPGKSGFDLCRAVRSRDETVPVLMLTAKVEEIDKVVAFELGADDYVTKPFSIRELLARIAALLRRARREAAVPSRSNAGPIQFTLGQVVVDALQYKITAGRRTLKISARELRLMQCFHAHPHEVLSREQLLNEVWGIDYYGTTRTLDQHIAQLRKKIEPDPGCPRFITTVYGIGYRYEPSPDEAS